MTFLWWIMWMILKWEAFSLKIWGLGTGNLNLNKLHIVQKDKEKENTVFKVATTNIYYQKYHILKYHIQKLKNQNRLNLIIDFCCYVELLVCRWLNLKYWNIT